MSSLYPTFIGDDIRAWKDHFGFSNNFLTVITEVIGLNSVKDLAFFYESEEILKDLKDNVKALEFVKFTRIKEFIGSIQSGEKATPETERELSPTKSQSLSKELIQWIGEAKLSEVNNLERELLNASILSIQDLLLVSEVSLEQLSKTLKPVPFRKLSAAITALQETVFGRSKVVQKLINTACDELKERERSLQKQMKNLESEIAKLKEAKVNIPSLPPPVPSKPPSPERYIPDVDHTGVSCLSCKVKSIRGFCYMSVTVPSERYCDTCVAKPSSHAALIPLLFRVKKKTDLPIAFVIVNKEGQRYTYGDISPEKPLKEKDAVVPVESLNKEEVKFEFTTIKFRPRSSAIKESASSKKDSEESELKMAPEKGPEINEPPSMSVVDKPVSAMRSEVKTPPKTSETNEHGHIRPGYSAFPGSTRTSVKPRDAPMTVGARLARLAETQNRSSARDGDVKSMIESKPETKDEVKDPGFVRRVISDSNRRHSTTAPILPGSEESSRPVSLRREYWKAKDEKRALDNKIDTITVAKLASDHL